MPKIAIINDRDIELPVTGDQRHEATGVRSCRLLTPPEYRLWLYLTELDDGGEIRWDAAHYDEAINILEGSLDVRGTRCPTGGAVIVENGVAGSVRAVGRTRIAHFGRRDPGPADKQGKYIHIGGPRGAWRVGRSELAWGEIWGDSSCPTCDVTFFRNCRTGVDPEPFVHSHKADEVIVLVEGCMLLGKRPFQPITAISIPGDIRYVQTCGEGGMAFLNFRSGPSIATHFRSDGRITSTPEDNRATGEPVDPFIDVPALP